MDLKPRPNRDKYIEILRKMTPAQRIQKAFELSEFTRQLFYIGMRQRHPQASEEELKHIALARLVKCHNSNY
jgi:hypothetical protein